MKRTIYTFFTVLCALFVMVSCSKSEDNGGGSGGNNNGNSNGNNGGNYTRRNTPPNKSSRDAYS